MTQGDLFRDEAIDQVEENADNYWMGRVIMAADLIACTFHEFTTDDIWNHLAEEEPELSTHEHRVMGAVMRKAQAEGWIEPTDQVVKSTRPVCHSRPIRVWRSKLI